MSSLATVMLYAALALGQPQPGDGVKAFTQDHAPSSAVTQYTALANETTDTANSLVRAYQNPKSKTECVNTKDFQEIISKRVGDLKRSWARIPKYQRTKEVETTTSTLNESLAKADEILNSSYRDNCSFCEDFSNERCEGLDYLPKIECERENPLLKGQCEILDGYLSSIEEATKALARFSGKVNRLKANDRDELYTAVISYSERMQGIEENAQDRMQLIDLEGRKGLLDLIEEKGQARTRTEFWTLMKGLERELELAGEKK